MLLAACRQGDVLAVQHCLNQGEDVRSVDSRGGSVLYHACLASRFDLVQLLYRFGACIRRPNDNGTTPLSCAVFMHRLDIAQWLFAMGADDINTPSITGCTPMFQACMSGAPLPILQWLYDNGADVRRKNGANYSPLHVASSFGRLHHGNFSFFLSNP
jgi:ankyrin repeat protein